VSGENYIPNILRVIKSRRMRMGGACSKYGREKRSVEVFGGEN